VGKRIKEPHDWVASVVRQLDPPPSFDVLSFPVGDRFVIVVRFDELTIKPCVTPSGAAYRRQGSQSVPVDHHAMTRWARSSEQLVRKAEKHLTAQLTEVTEQTWRSPGGTFIAATTFAVGAMVPGLTVPLGASFSDLPERLVAIEQELPIRSTGDRRAQWGIAQHTATAASEVKWDEAWLITVDGEGLARVIYFHAWLRPVRFPHEPEFAPRWPKRTREMFLSRALGAAEEAIAVATGVSASEFRRDLLAGLCFPAMGRLRPRRGKPDAGPIAIATRWKQPGRPTAFVQDVLVELSRAPIRPFSGERQL
jgi:hypothetical protein